MKRIVVLALVAMLLAACGGDEPAPSGTASPTPSAPTPTTGTTTGPPAVGMGPGVTIEEALAGETDGPLLVNGYIVAEADVVRLCGALAESMPPQCGGDSLEVVGIDLDDYGVAEAQGVAWTDEQVQVLGEVDGGVLRVSAQTTG